jgi:nucleoside-diphosphate-sugar epimerase
MDVLLIGGGSNLMDAVINKLNKEGHRAYVLTGNPNKVSKYKNAYERYYFSYDSDSLNEIFDSIRPDVTMFMGAYDTNFDWIDDRREAVRYSAGLVNILMAQSMLEKGRFLYLSSEEVYTNSSLKDYSEVEPHSARGFRSMTIVQGEEACQTYSQTMGMDTVTLRLDHLYDISMDDNNSRNICAKMCAEAVQKGKISANARNVFSMLYLADAVEFIYRVMDCKKTKHSLYHITSGEVINEMKLAEMIQEEMGSKIMIEDHSVGDESRVVLSGNCFREEFDSQIFHSMEKMVPTMVRYIKHHQSSKLDRTNVESGFFIRLLNRIKGILLALIPFVENVVCFIPFFMLNNRAVGSEYFGNLDFYLIYVLLFAIVYGQQQATLSAVLAVAGYIFRQMYHRSGFEVVLDYNTYVWIAQLFILGLIVGYMRDQLKVIRGEDEKEIHFLSGQLSNIQDINNSNVRMKNVLETQIVNQNDSFGKIYEITSSLDQYEPEEVLFYASEILSNLINSKDVAIYTVANRSYARLFSATSKKARELGNSIHYTALDEMYQELIEHRVYINKTLDEKYPLMANAIYSENDMQLIIMVWGIPWERMTLSQANMLVVVGYLIQNAVIRANRYLEALKNNRYVEGTNILGVEAFASLVKAYLGAKRKGLTECTILKIEVETANIDAAGAAIGEMMRQTDYLGKLSNGGLYALLSNTDSKDADFVTQRFLEAGYKSIIWEESLE